jgi:hypothetical protein
MGYAAHNEPCHEVEVMQNKPRTEQKISDAELIALVRKAQQDFEAQGEPNEVNLLLRDFAKNCCNRVRFSG